METVSYDQALKNLETGGLTGSTLDMAKDSLRRSYNATEKSDATESTPQERYSRISNTDSGALYGSGTSENKARSVLYDISDYDESGRRDAMMNAAHAKIALIDNKYDQKVAEERKVGEKDVARSNTISALTGMAGSPEATTREGGAERRTQERINTVNEMRANEIAAIYGQIDENIQKEKEAHLQTQRENAGLLLDEVARNAKTALSRFAGAGISWDQLEATDPDTLDKLVKQSGTDAFTLREVYNKSLPQAQRPEQLFSGWKGGNFVIIERDPITGEVKNRSYSSDQLGIPKGTNVGTITLGDSVYWYDQDQPLGPNGQPDLIRVGARPGSGSGGNSIPLSADDRRTLLSVNLSANDISDIEKSVNEFGIDATLNALETQAQKDAVTKVYGGKESSTNLTRESIAKLYGLDDNDTKTGGFLGIGAKTGKEQLDEIMDTIDRYKGVGYSDDEILKLIKGSGK